MASLFGVGGSGNLVRVPTDVTTRLRDFNVSYQPHMARPVLVLATVDISVNRGENGKIELYVDDVDPPAALVGRARTNFSSDSLNSFTVDQETQLVGFVPPGWYYRIATGTLAGAPFFALRDVKELVL